MKTHGKIIACTVLVLIFLYSYGMGNVHFGAEGPKVSKKIIWGWNVQNIACAASERQHPAGEYEVDNEGVNDQIGNSGIQDEGLITLLRIVSVAAMSFFLVWYIWRRLRL